MLCTLTSSKMKESDNSCFSESSSDTSRVVHISEIQQWYTSLDMFEVKSLILSGCDNFVDPVFYHLVPT